MINHSRNNRLALRNLLNGSVDFDGNKVLLQRLGDCCGEPQCWRHIGDLHSVSQYDGVDGDDGGDLGEMEEHADDSCVSQMLIHGAPHFSFQNCGTRACIRNSPDCSCTGSGGDGGVV